VKASQSRRKPARAGRRPNGKHAGIHDRHHTGTGDAKNRALAGGYGRAVGRSARGRRRRRGEIATEQDQCGQSTPGRKLAGRGFRFLGRRWWPELIGLREQQGLDLHRRLVSIFSSLDGLLWRVYLTARRRDGAWVGDFQGRRSGEQEDKRPTGRLSPPDDFQQAKSVGLAELGTASGKAPVLKLGRAVLDQ